MTPNTKPNTKLPLASSVITDNVLCLVQSRVLMNVDVLSKLLPQKVASGNYDAEFINRVNVCLETCIDNLNSLFYEDSKENEEVSSMD